MKFEKLGLVEPILGAVEVEGYLNATPIQQQAIPKVLKGHDLMGCAQTGTGKTAAFALPTLQRLFESHGNDYREIKRQRRARDGRRTRSLVLSPTRELAAQIGDCFAAYSRYTSLRHAVIYGGVSQSPQVRALRDGVDTLIATPGRLLDLMNQGYVDLSGVEILTLDEADRMLDMGFIHDLKKIVRQVPRKKCQTLMFSATMPKEIRQLAAQWLYRPVNVQVAPESSPAEKVQQSVYFVEKKEKPRLLANFLHNAMSSRTLVFSRTKRGADKIVRVLKREGIEAAAIHGNKSQTARNRVLQSFKSDRLPVLVATDIAARGLDVDGISHVINYDMPHDAETYVHRIGRTGRAGAAGVAVTFCGQDEHSRLRSIERLIRRSIAVEKGPLSAGETKAHKEPLPERSAAQSPRRRRSKTKGGFHKGRRNVTSPRGSVSKKGRRRDKVSAK